MDVPQTATLTVRWDGQPPRTITRDMGVGGRAAVSLDETVPGPGNWNGTVEMRCAPGWCAETVSIYADNLKRGTVASHPQVKWGCK